MFDVIHKWANLTVESIFMYQRGSSHLLDTYEVFSSLIGLFLWDKLRVMRREMQLDLSTWFHFLASLYHPRTLQLARKQEFIYHFQKKKKNHYKFNQNHYYIYIKKIIKLGISRGAHKLARTSGYRKTKTRRRRRRRSQNYHTYLEYNDL